MEKIFYLAKDATAASQIIAGLAKIKYPNADIVATDGLDETAMAALVTALTDNTCDDIVICMPTVATHAAGKFTFAQAVTLIPKLKTAKQGTNVTGTCQANATATNIKLAASGPSAVDNFYNGKLIATAGTTAVTKLITDYVGSTKVCTVATTGTAVTTTETYTVYMTTYLHLYGELNYAGSSENAVWTAYAGMFPNAKQSPTLVSMFNGKTLYEQDTVTASGACAAATVVDSGQFTLDKYTGKDYWVILETATTGGGQIRKIVSNTTGALTVSPPWDPTPTGTPVYSVKEGKNRLGWDLYLLKAIPTYLGRNTQENFTIMKRMMDQYGDLAAGGAAGFEEEALIEKYANLGKVICDAIWAGVVS